MSRLAGRLRLAVATAAALVAVAAVALTGSALQEEEPFPHAEHAGLFPVCTGCHAGVPDGNEADFYPEPEQCVGCHDGEEYDEVSWAPPEGDPDNLVYSHPEHARLMEVEGEPAQSCQSCHAEPDREAGRMAVEERVRVESCLECHTHEAREHYEDADCATCHAPLAETGFSEARVSELPVPPSHDAGTFLPEVHGEAAEDETARCAVCHTQDRCVACHVDAERAPIQALPRAPEGMRLPPAPAHYPVPESHGDEAWLQAHGDEVQASECSTCHATEDCTVCHLQPAPDLARALPSRAAVPAPGVQVERRAPESHASLFFQEAHATLAASRPESCATCHAESYCAECHDGPRAGGYHPPDFVAQHSATAYGQEAECSTCHNTAVFCRSCHVETGMGSQGRLGPGYHDAEPVWLLRHGQAARQNLEGCVSCHEQRDCMQCHSTLGSFQISPHPVDFDAAAAWARNPRTCLACHARNPIGVSP